MFFLAWRLSKHEIDVVSTSIFSRIPKFNSSQMSSCRKQFRELASLGKNTMGGTIGEQGRHF